MDSTVRVEVDGEGNVGAGNQRARPSVDLERRKVIEAMADRIGRLGQEIDAATHEQLTQLRAFDDLDGWHVQGALTADEVSRCNETLDDIPRLQPGEWFGHLQGHLHKHPRHLQR